MLDHDQLAPRGGHWIGHELGLDQVPAQLGRAGDFPGDLAQ
ncbi:hypothetical protein ACIA5D_15165 [Actinoplanes sp. NPDC051513]